MSVTIQEQHDLWQSVFVASLTQLMALNGQYEITDEKGQQLVETSAKFANGALQYFTDQFGTSWNKLMSQSRVQ